MKFALNITDWRARAPGLIELESWLTWAKQDWCIIPDKPQAKLTELPMMTARRLNSGSRLAVDCGMDILRQYHIDAVVFTSRHGELERNYRILQALSTGQAISPTDFAMSVHNSAVGNLTIATKKPLVSSSVSAGIDTFQQGLYEVLALHQSGCNRVLMVDFDGSLPSFYHPWLPDSMPVWAYAVALVIEPGQALHCESISHPTQQPEPELAQSLQFLKGWLNPATPTFRVSGDQRQWLWSRT